MKRLTILVLASILFAAPGSAEAGAGKGSWYSVEKVISGDSFSVEGGAVISFISVVAPDPMSEVKRIEDFGKESLEYNRKLLAGRKVQLEWGSRIRDRKGRYLAYVYTDDGTFANSKVLEDGFAKLAIEPPNLEHSDELTESATSARREKRGLWAHEVERVSITFIGDQMKKEYHYPDCEELDHVPQGHRRIFRSSVEAKSEQYSFCNICKRIPRQNTDLF